MGLKVENCIPRAVDEELKGSNEKDPAKAGSFSLDSGGRLMTTYSVNA
jgi:hypothetical protein